MTENEAIQVFKELLDVPCEMLIKYDSVANEEQKKALVRIRLAEEMAIKALEELKAIKQWKSEVMEGFCKYDASSFEEIVAYARAKSIDDFAETLKEEYIFEGICRDDISKYEYENKINRMVKQLKAGVQV